MCGEGSQLGEALQQLRHSGQAPPEHSLQNAFLGQSQKLTSNPTTQICNFKDTWASAPIINFSNYLYETLPKYPG